MFCVFQEHEELLKQSSAQKSDISEDSKAQLVLDEIICQQKEQQSQKVENNLAAFQRNIESLNEQMVTQQVVSLQEDNAASLKRKARLCDELVDAQKRMEALGEENAMLQTRIESLSGEGCGLHERISAIEEENPELLERSRNLTEEKGLLKAAADGALADEENKLAQAVKKGKSLQKRVKDLEAKLECLEAEKLHLAESVAALTEDNLMYEQATNNKSEDARQLR